MNVQQALDILDAKGDAVPTDFADVDAFMYEFGINEIGWSEKFNSRVTAKYIETWLCTDTYVGTAIVFFDGCALALTKKDCRKCDTHVFFLDSPETGVLLEKFKAFLLTLHEEPELNSPELYPMSTEIEFRRPEHYDRFYSRIQADASKDGI